MKNMISVLQAPNCLLEGAGQWFADPCMIPRAIFDYWNKIEWEKAAQGNESLGMKTIIKFLKEHVFLKKNARNLNWPAFFLQKKKKL